MVQHTFPGIAPIVIGTRTLDARLDKTAAGKAFTAGFQEISPSLAGNKVSLRLHNPAGSGKTMYVTGVYIRSSIAQRVDIDQPTTPNQASLGTNTPTLNKLSGGLASVGSADYKNNSAGVSVANPDPSTGVVANQGVYIPLASVLLPNSSISLDFSSATTADADTAFFEWYEE